MECLRRSLYCRLGLRFVVMLSSECLQGFEYFFQSGFISFLTCREAHALIRSGVVKDVSMNVGPPKVEVRGLLVGPRHGE